VSGRRPVPPPPKARARTPAPPPPAAASPWPWAAFGAIFGGGGLRMRMETRRQARNPLKRKGGACVSRRFIIHRTRGGRARRPALDGGLEWRPSPTRAARSAHAGECSLLPTSCRSARALLTTTNGGERRGRGVRGRQVGALGSAMGGKQQQYAAAEAEALAARRRRSAREHADLHSLPERLPLRASAQKIGASFGVGVGLYFAALRWRVSSHFSLARRFRCLSPPPFHLQTRQRSRPAPPRRTGSSRCFA